MLSIKTLASKKRLWGIRELSLNLPLMREKNRTRFVYAGQRQSSFKPGREEILVKAFGCVIVLALFLPIGAAAQTDDTWPPLNYLRSDYKSVRIVAHVRIREAEIVNRIPGYDNWKIVAEVIEPFKGKFRKGETIKYFHGAEAPSKKEFFT